MNREIKFRCWEEENKRMIYDVPSDYEGILMQFINLKDKNGKEIYEGDIVLGRFILDNTEDYIYLSLTDKEKQEQSKLFVIKDIFYPYTNPMPDDLEVIGNIYENPNLINNKNHVKIP